FVAGMSDFIDGRIPKRQITPAAQINNYYGGLNNNSNNMVYKSVVEGGVSTEATLRSGGFASGTFEIGRNSSNQIYLKDPAATVYVLGTYSGPVKTCATIQAPAWVRVLSVT
ncbi:MAG: hypothetical protein QG650_860, partial [Patescibacteria group bacterium]|nr:hypothetical protein [Patescibacteria group bacterium]